MTDKIEVAYTREQFQSMKSNESFNEVTLPNRVIRTAGQRLDLRLRKAKENIKLDGTLLSQSYLMEAYSAIDDYQTTCELWGAK